MKMLLTNEDARTAGVNALSRIADAVCTTLGPNARPAIFDKYEHNTGNTPIVSSKDGLTVLRALEFDDPILNAVLNLANSTTAAVVMQAGDGTTSVLRFASTLARAILEENHISPQFFARQMLAEAERAIECITKEATTSDEMNRLVANISTNGDEELSSAVLKAISLAGARGTVNVQKHPNQKEKIAINKVDGYSRTRGYNGHTPIAFSIDESKASANGIITLNEPFVFLFNGDISSMQQIDPIIDKLSDKYGKNFNLVLVGLKRTEEISNNLTVLNLKTMSKDSQGQYLPGSGRVFITEMDVRTPEINGPLQAMFDIASFSGGRVFDGASCLNPDLQWLGRVRQVEIAPDKTTFLGRSPNNWILKRIDENTVAVDRAPSDLDRECINMRTAELADGLVNLSVGGAHYAQINQIADAADDAIRAVQTTMMEGALPPCGVSYCRAADLADSHPAMRKALQSIHRQLMDNLGLPYRKKMWQLSRPSLPKFREGETIKVKPDGTVEHGHFAALGIADCAATIAAVIRHGARLAVLVSTCGAMSLTSNIGDMRHAHNIKRIME